MNHKLTDNQLEELLERAAHRGAVSALKSVGLQDDDAPNDVRDLRSLIDGWRSVKKSILHTVVKALVIFLLGILSMGAWTNFHD